VAVAKTFGPAAVDPNLREGLMVHSEMPISVLFYQPTRPISSESFRSCPMSQRMDYNAGTPAGMKALERVHRDMPAPAKTEPRPS
jgi:hypothetical protein